MASYKYQNLTSSHVYGSAEEPSPPKIRILTLQPGAGNDTIHCSLRTEKLAEVVDNQTYETLSYSWGVEDASMSIFLGDGAVRDDNFHNHPRNMWIDAICINQADNVERSYQVPLMRRIYEGAIGTLIWLGEGTTDSKTAINLVQSLKNARMKCGNDLPTFDLLDSDYTKYNLPPLFSKDYPRFLTMIKQPYFGRAWIVQEVAVSKKARLYWGSDSVDWDDFGRGIDFATRTHMAFALHPAMNRLMEIMEEAVRYKSGHCRLLPSLLRHRSCQATVPVDKVYALLGLTEKTQKNVIPINVDYEQDLATAYIHAARKIVEYDRSLDILSLPATSFETEILGLPSWVPDWSVWAGTVPRQSFSASSVSF